MWRARASLVGIAGTAAGSAAYCHGDIHIANPEGFASESLGLKRRFTGCALRSQIHWESYDPYGKSDPGKVVIPMKR